MGLYKITVKKKSITNGVVLEKGMSVEVVTRDSTRPLSSSKNRQNVIDAFMRIYGVDLKKAGKMSTSYLMQEKIN